MDLFKNMSQSAQIVLGGAVLCLIISFFDWQQVSAFGSSAGWNEWHGFLGVLAGLSILLLIAWELARALKLNITVGSFSPGLVSLALAVLLLVLTIVAFIDKSDFRHWPSYVGLILAFVVAAFAFKRSREEGVEIPRMPAGGAAPGGGGDGGASV